MRVKFEIDEKALREIIAQHIYSRLGKAIEFEHVLIQVKSEQNYKSEWENAAFRASYECKI